MWTWLRYFGLAFGVGVLPLGIVYLPPLLPGADLGASRHFLEVLVPAQAGLIALPFAVTAFLLEGVRGRDGLSDLGVESYFRATLVTWLLPTVVGTLLGGVLTVVLIQPFGLGVAPQGLSNLLLVAIVNTFVTVLATLILFGRALQFVMPRQWRALETKAALAVVAEDARRWADQEKAT